MNSHDPDSGAADPAAGRGTLPPPAPPGLRILYLCHRVPYPPDKGDKIRAFHQIRALSQPPPGRTC